MPGMIILFIVCLVLFSIYMPFASKVTSWGDMALRLVSVGLGGVVVGLMFREGPFFAILRFVMVDIAYILAYVIIKMILSPFIERSREKSKGKPKNDTIIEFDGEVYPIVDEQADIEARH